MRHNASAWNQQPVAHEGGGLVFLALIWAGNAIELWQRGTSPAALTAGDGLLVVGQALLCLLLLGPLVGLVLARRPTRRGVTEAGRPARNVPLADRLARRPGRAFPRRQRPARGQRRGGRQAR